MPCNNKPNANGDVFPGSLIDIRTIRPAGQPLAPTPWSTRSWIQTRLDDIDPNAIIDLPQLSAELSARIRSDLYRVVEQQAVQRYSVLLSLDLGREEGAYPTIEEIDAGWPLPTLSCWERLLDDDWL